MNTKHQIKKIRGGNIDWFKGENFKIKHLKKKKKQKLKKKKEYKIWNQNNLRWNWITIHTCAKWFKWRKGR
jgi:hypothetical protein